MYNLYVHTYLCVYTCIYTPLVYTHLYYIHTSVYTHALCHPSPLSHTGPHTAVCSQDKIGYIRIHGVCTILCVQLLVHVLYVHACWTHNIQQQHTQSFFSSHTLNHHPHHTHTQSHTHNHSITHTHNQPQAPELLVRTSESITYDGAKVDIWSLGVALFFMLTKAYPFEIEVKGSETREVAIMRVCVWVWV